MQAIRKYFKPCVVTRGLKMTDLTDPSLFAEGDSGGGKRWRFHSLANFPGKYPPFPSGATMEVQCAR